MDTPGSHRTRGRYRGTGRLRSGSRHRTRLHASSELIRVIEGTEPDVSVPACERPSKEAIREPRVFWESRTVEIAADHFALHRALGLVLAVVAVPGDDRSERLGARPEVRPSGMVLESDERSVRRVHQQIPDEAFPASAGRDVENPESWDRRADLRNIFVPQELVAAADREDRGAAVDRFP